MRRQDIQGLRALGAVLVAVFHIFQLGVSGGVDVFFTVSGFFLWSSTVNLVEREAGYLDHFNKFFKRTAPQAILVVSATLVFGLLLTSPIEWRSILKDAAFSVVFLQNYWLAHIGQDYLARQEGLSLFQHFWAISVIAQVYFIFPTVAFMAALAARFLSLPKKKTLIIMLSMVSILSLAWSIYFSARTPEIAYFDTFSRIWQFGFGALSANLLNRREVNYLNGHWADFLSWVGLIAVLACGPILGQSFPGAASVWPTAAAVLILIFSQEENRPRNSGFILSRRYLAKLGAVSFGIYLWHWPIYALSFRFTSEVTYLSAIFIVFSSLALATLSAATIKCTTSIFDRFDLRSYGLSTASALGIVIVGASCFILERAIQTNSSILMSIRHPLTGVSLSTARIRQDVPSSYGLGCHQNSTNSDLAICSYGDIESSRSVYLLGGSHSAQWLPALEKIALHEKLHLVSITKSSCRFFDPDVDAMVDYLSESCRDWNRNVLEFIRSNTPDVVITLANTSGDDAPVGIGMALAHLVDLDISVIALRDTPSMDFDVTACITQLKLFDLPDCRVLRESVLDDQKYAETLTALPESILFVDMNDQICPNRHCDVLRGEQYVWRDSHHITASFASALSDILWARISHKLNP